MAGKDAAEKDDAAEAKGGKLKLIIMVLPVVLLLAGAGWYFFLRPAEDTGPVTLPDPTPGPVVDVDPITINLAGGHFLKLGISLQPTATAEAPTGAKALDLAIDQFSGKTMEELSTKEGRERNKAELVARVKLAYLPAEAHAAEAEEAASQEEGAEESSESSDEESGGEEEAESVSDDEELTAEQAIKKAAELQFQPEVYDVYFTQFVMQ